MTIPDKPNTKEQKYIKNSLIKYEENYYYINNNHIYNLPFPLHFYWVGCKWIYKLELFNLVYNFLLIIISANDNISKTNSIIINSYFNKIKVNAILNIN